MYHSVESVSLASGLPGGWDLICNLHYLQSQPLEAGEDNKKRVVEQLEICM